MLTSPPPLRRRDGKRDHAHGQPGSSPYYASWSTRHAPEHRDQTEPSDKWIWICFGVVVCAWIAGSAAALSSALQARRCSHQEGVSDSLDDDDSSLMTGSPSSIFASLSNIHGNDATLTTSATITSETASSLDDTSSSRTSTSDSSSTSKSKSSTSKSKSTSTKSKHQKTTSTTKESETTTTSPKEDTPKSSGPGQKILFLCRLSCELIFKAFRPRHPQQIQKRVWC